MRAGATATELMVASTLIAAAYNMPGTPEEWKELPPSSAALLVEFRAEEPDALDEPERIALQILEGRPLIGEPGFTRDRGQIEMLWHVREGMYGLLAAIRPPGVTLITEDVCVPPSQVAAAAKDLQALLSRHGFLPGVAGHASAGNLHFTLTPDFAKPDDLERYDAFIHELVELIIDRYDGSLKAEHGTGINMAPFVQREWGSKATELMWRVKTARRPGRDPGPRDRPQPRPGGAPAQPQERSRDRRDRITKCIECGFCEPVCPSRNVTTTPRQRIVLRREMARQPPGSPVLEALLAQYEYDAIQTCAADGSCATACPVAIDTGKLVKQLRHREHSPRAERAALAVARRYALGERLARVSVGVGGRRRPRRRAGVVGVDGQRATGRALRSSADSEDRRRRGVRPLVPEPHPRQRARRGPATDAARGAGHGLGPRRTAAVDPRRRGRPLLRGALELEGLPRRSRAHERPYRGGAAPLERQRPPAGGDRRQLLHARGPHRARPRRRRGARLDRLGARPSAASGCGSLAGWGASPFIPLVPARSSASRASCVRSPSRSLTRSWFRPPPVAAGWPATAAGFTPSCPRLRWAK